ncbi:MAG: hypothetical protein HOM20_08025 [Porticoccaceae bacterium]|jgi:predicted nucleotidyltransferase|nr:hypothetical protein [Porticoccaceae bacterium]
MIDISERIPDDEKELLVQLVGISEKFGCEFLIIGATARDFIGYRYGLPQKRATEDTDIAIEVSSWKKFELFKEALLSEGFAELENKPHRLISPKGRMLDVVPYGGVADEDQNIHWPPDNAMTMSVLGFDEALRLAESYSISQKPSVSIQAPSIEGLICLKFLAWLDRPAELKQKDALDIRHLLESSEKILAEKVYEDQGLLATYDFQTDQIAAHLLGRNIKASVSQEVLDKIAELKDSKAKYRGWEEFILDMLPLGRLNEQDTQIQRNLLSAFFNGLTE